MALTINNYMITFKQHYLLKEITEDTILYHRSLDTFTPNQILTPQHKFQGNHHLSKSYIEQKLEEFRQNHKPEAPSRMDCVYASVVPRSAFFGRGKLYEVRPIGNFHITMAYYINQIVSAFEDISYTYLEDLLGPAPWRNDKNPEESDKQLKEYLKRQDEMKFQHSESKLIGLFAQYWGVGPNSRADIYKTDPKWVEVLCEQVQIVKMVEEEDDVFRKGDNVEITQDITATWYGYAPDGNTKLSNEENEEISKQLNAVKGKYGGYEVHLPKGMKGTVSTSLPWYSKIRKYKERDIPEGNTSRYHRLYFQPNGLNTSVNISTALYDPKIGFKNATEYLRKI